MDIRKLMSFLTFTAFAVLGVLTMPANAGFIILNNPSQFSDNQTLITFDEGDFNGNFLSPFEVVTSYRRGVSRRVIGVVPYG